MDADLDGDIDIVGIDEGGASFYLNQGNQTFGAPILATGDGGGALMVADFDNSGGDDLAIATDCGVQLFLRQASGALTLSSNAFPAIKSLPRSARVADVDRDGDLDVLVLGASNQMFLNDVPHQCRP